MQLRGFTFCGGGGVVAPAGMPGIVSERDRSQAFPLMILSARLL